MVDRDLEAALARKAAQLGKLAVRMTTHAGSGHPSSALSLAHIVTVLMYRVMRYDPSDPWNRASDRLVLSEGHAVPIVYAAYADLRGAVGRSSASSTILDVDDLSHLREITSILDGHPNPAIGFHFFDAATGSLGQGLSVAAGIGLAARLDGSDRRAFALVGDGESREGQIWEAIDFLADHRLTNVTAVFNCNGQGQSDYVSDQQSPETIGAKLAAYGMETRDINGHDVGAILDALTTPPSADAPVCIVARTRKGWGVRALQDVGWHGKPLPEDKLHNALADLDAEEKKIAEPEKGISLVPEVPGVAAFTVTLPQKMASPDFDALLSGDPFEQKFRATRKISARRAYGLALRELGKIDPAVVALDGDVSNSTFSHYFKEAFPDRFFECRIAEQNMVSVAGGLAAQGKIPFASTFGKFLARAYDQVEMGVISRHNMKLVGSHVGASIGADGPSQMALTDLAFFRAFPAGTDEAPESQIVVFVPADGIAAYRAVDIAHRHVGPVYIRTYRSDMPLLYDSLTRFEIGGAHEVCAGDDVTLVASGYMLHLAREAVDLLREAGIAAGLIDVYSYPIRSPLVLDLAASPRHKILAVEDNYGGGLGSALAELASQARGARVWRMTCRRTPKSGRTGDEVIAWLGLDPKHIAERARELART